MMVMYRGSIYPALFVLSLLSLLLMSWLFPLQVYATEPEQALYEQLPDVLPSDEPLLDEQPQQDDGQLVTSPEPVEFLPEPEPIDKFIFNMDSMQEGEGLSGDDVHAIRVLLEFIVYGLVPFLLASVCCFYFIKWFLRSFIWV